jgi:subtilisin family serine protease
MRKLLTSLLLIAIILIMPLNIAVTHPAPLNPVNLPLVNSNHNRAEQPWWETTALDLNRNRIHDYLEEEAGQLNIIVDYSSEITFIELDTLRSLGLESSLILEPINAVTIHNADAALLPTIASLDGVVMVEGMGLPALASDVATPAAKAKESAEYSPLTAWELGYSGKGVTLAIMDTGIDDEHPSLAGKWAGGADFTKPDAFIFPRDGTYNADDTGGHGTTCAGISTGTGAPEFKYQGTAPDTMLADLRIGTILGIGPGELPYIQDIYDSALEATEWAIQHKDDQWQGAPPENEGIDILSLSWGIFPEGEATSGGSDGTDAYSRLLDQLMDAGVITVVAAGNEGPDNDGMWCMGTASKVITVGATDDRNTIIRDDDKIASYSSRGPRKDNGDGYPYDELKPDVTAPGTDITQCVYSQNPLGSADGYGGRGSGTSYATPLVAGVVALMLEANQNITSSVAKEILRMTAQRTGEPTFPELDPFWNKDYGYGVVDSFEAVRAAERLEDVAAVNVELQCFVMNRTIEDNEMVFSGISWAKLGKVEGVEVRLDGGPWLPASSLMGASSGSEGSEASGEGDGSASDWAKWEYRHKLSKLEPGNHTVEARAVEGAKSSIAHAIQFQTTGYALVEEPGLVPPWVAMSMVLVMACVILAYALKNKDKVISKVSGKASAKVKPQVDKESA